MRVICWVSTHTLMLLVPGTEAETDQLPPATFDVFEVI